MHCVASVVQVMQEERRQQKLPASAAALQEMDTVSQHRPVSQWVQVLAWPTWLLQLARFTWSMPSSSSPAQGNNLARCCHSQSRQWRCPLGLSKG